MHFLKFLEFFFFLDRLEEEAYQFILGQDLRADLLIQAGRTHLKALAHLDTLHSHLLHLDYGSYHLFHFLRTRTRRPALHLKNRAEKIIN